MIKSLYAFVKSVVSIYKLSEKPLPSKTNIKRRTLPPAEEEDSQQNKSNARPPGKKEHDPP